ncbi:MAG: transposase [Actinobacteria bacterium]|nr:transposase [Actinomycetota bacterium]
MLRLHAGPLDTLWETLLPPEVRALPEDLARADLLLEDPTLLEPFRAHGQRSCPGAVADGRPTIPMQTYLRLMLVKHRCGWGYETLVREVADSVHLRRFCLIPLHERVPDESTVRKLTRRLGPEVTDALVRSVISLAARERRFRARALRVDSTVAEADIRYPTEAGLCAQAVRVVARAARRLAAAAPAARAHVRDRSRAVQKRLRELGRTLRRRTEEAKGAVQCITEEAAAQVRSTIREARALAWQARRSRARATKAARTKAAAELERVTGLAERVVEQVRQRFAGEKIESASRLVSLFDTDARPVRRGKLGRPNEFGYVVQLAEVTAHTRRGARGLLLPPKCRAGSTHENTLLPGTAKELVDLGMAPCEVSLDAGFGPAPTAATMATVNPTIDIFIAGSKTNAGSRRTRRRRARYRVGCEARIAHLKREYGAGRSRLKGESGARIWEGWAAFAYDVDTAAALPPRNTS